MLAAVINIGKIHKLVRCTQPREQVFAQSGIRMQTIPFVLFGLCVTPLFVEWISEIIRAHFSQSVGLLTQWVSRLSIAAPGVWPEFENANDVCLRTHPDVFTFTVVWIPSWRGGQADDVNLYAAGILWESQRSIQPLCKGHQHRARIWTFSHAHPVKAIFVAERGLLLWDDCLHLHPHQLYWLTLSLQINAHHSYSDYYPYFFTCIIKLFSFQPVLDFNNQIVSFKVTFFARRKIKWELLQVWIAKKNNTQIKLLGDL